MKCEEGILKSVEEKGKRDVGVRERILIKMCESVGERAEKAERAEPGSSDVRNGKGCRCFAWWTRRRRVRSSHWAADFTEAIQLRKSSTLLPLRDD